MATRAALSGAHKEISELSATVEALEGTIEKLEARREVRRVRELHADLEARRAGTLVLVRGR